MDFHENVAPEQTRSLCRIEQIRFKTLDIADDQRPPFRKRLQIRVLTKGADLQTRAKVIERR